MKPREGNEAFDLLKVESYIHAESTIGVVCEQPFDEVAARLEGSIAANGMTILHRHDLDQVLAERSMPLSFRCRVYEVCDPLLTARLLSEDPALAHLLPLRIAMHDRRGVTMVTTAMPTVLMTEFSHAASVARLARSFEAGLGRVLRGVR